MENQLEKMDMSLTYIIECKHVPNLKNCEGNKLVIGVDLSTIYFISNLSMLLGKAQVYFDQANNEFFEDMVLAFWNKYEEEIDIEDFNSYYENKTLSNE